jgi:uncharacterized protein with NRDE domain
MCTLVALFHAHPSIPLIVGANRDEMYARPWASPAVLSEAGAASPIVGGRDLTQGGTWLGVTLGQQSRRSTSDAGASGGFFVGVTNQRTRGAPDPTKRSRGQLVLEALSRGDVDAACDHLTEIDAREYNPFNLLVGDARALYVVYARGDRGVTIEPLPPGIWVLNNDAIGSRDFPKASRARDLIAPIARDPWDRLAGELGTALGDHALPDEALVPEPPADVPFPRDLFRTLQALCVHTPVYGTSSSSILALEEGRVRDYLFAAGPPCVTPFARPFPVAGGAVHLG